MSYAGHNYCIRIVESKLLQMKAISRSWEKNVLHFAFLSEIEVYASKFYLQHQFNIQNTKNFSKFSILENNF